MQDIRKTLVLRRCKILKEDLLRKKSRRRWQSVSRESTKAFLKMCERSFNNSCSVLDEQGNIVVFSTYRDTTLPKFK